MTSAFDGSEMVKRTLLTAFDAAAEDARIPKLADLLKEAPARIGAGYPEALARFVDRIVGTLAQRSPAGRRVEVRSLARRCLAEVAPGADLAAVPVRILEVMLWKVETRADLRTAAPALRDILLAVIDLQNRRLDGADVARREWAAIRERAVSLTDGFEDPNLNSAGLAIEGAAWDVTTSSGVLIDILMPYSALFARDAVRAQGWTADDDRRSEAMLQEIYDETTARVDAGEPISIPEQFRGRDPELARRYEQQLETRVDGGRAVCRALLDHVLILLAGASVAAPEAVGA